MGNSKHTPGPWRGDERNPLSVLAGTSTYVGCVCFPRGEPKKRPGENTQQWKSRTRPEREAIEAEQRANRDLFVAAPDLLAACEAAKSYLAKSAAYTPDRLCDELVHAQTAVAAAITKAGATP